ncbi:MAG: hypothetical protein KGQ37_05660 [Hyphomicrobiales bacterium]|nr:hypothetical protein [Hyphomicrobiales bacterium]
MRTKSFASALLASALVAAAAMTLANPARADGDRNGALLGGLAAGLVGGAILDHALNQPRPVYVAPAQPVYVARDPYFERLHDLKRECDLGDRNDCIRFGMMIGQHREHIAAWRREDPDMFMWDNQ